VYQLIFDRNILENVWYKILEIFVSVPKKPRVMELSITEIALQEHRVAERMIRVFQIQSISVTDYEEILSRRKRPIFFRNDEKL
jgi:hypothetical protein